MSSTTIKTKGVGPTHAAATVGATRPAAPKAVAAPAVPATSQALGGIRALGSTPTKVPRATAAPVPTAPRPPVKPTPATPSPLPAQSIDQRLQQARDHRPTAEQLSALPAQQRPKAKQVYAAEQSRQYDAIATELEATDTSRLDTRETAAYGDQLEEAQQGSKPAREARLRTELQGTAVGRELLEFERRAGVPVEIYTDRESHAAGLDGAGGIAVPDGPVRFNVRSVDADTYVHEMTHQVDHLTRVIHPAHPGDDRSRAEVTAEATERYRSYGLDPREVPAVVDATYDAADSGFSKTHGHTRLAEARLHREQDGGPVLTDAELREVLSVSVPRERDIEARNAYNSSHNELLLSLYAASRGIDVEGRSPEQLLAAVESLAQHGEDRIAAIEARGASVAGAPDKAGAPGK